YGNDQFYSFYRYFLLRLFHEALGGLERDPDLEELIGNVPYLNGGIFELHQIEKDNPDIYIPDEAFERTLDFFDQYQWHLDDRPLRSDNEINPDVLGYIFEKYINQKQMGAYYTKEDITEYISKNTIIPYIFSAAQKTYPHCFKGDDSFWILLEADPGRYIYEAVQKGVDKPLPDKISLGEKDVSRREGWNTQTLEKYALPTEIWRETVARRHRYFDLRDKLEKGEIREINDLITNNLDIQQFAQDVIETCDKPETLRAFWKAIREVTILDPTCGSGAFLFAALNILQPLYEACLIQMKVFIDEYPEATDNSLMDFKDTLANVSRHPNEDYFILKSIIVNNIFGVDIMPEAVEIAKLRLFLKLAAQVEPDRSKENWGIEPLPDIDFNIRSGNT
ncbi:SAM-dependent methyltransferase, partial [bacterium]|nr:SAM-dependent methyltransferase [bacterium]